jgi:sugar phosphate isomerase/epimerase
MEYGLSLSTSWNISRYINAEDYIRELEEIGFSRIEVNYQVTQKFVDDITPYVENGRLEVTSVHNICPQPQGYKSADLELPLSSIDEEIRRKAVEYTIETVNLAHRFGAMAVVIHIGQVDGLMEYNDRLRDLFRRGLYGSPDFIDTRKKIIKDRKSLKQGNIEACEKSLYELSDYIFKKGYDVKLGLENRDKYDQIPVMEEYEIWFEKFKDCPIGLWYDIGHGEVHRNVLDESCICILEKYKDKLLGFHIHDTDGISDHHAPGMKKTNFELYRDYINLDVCRVLELKPFVLKEEILEGVRVLKEKMYWV